jgi:glycosyltransferase involved in cell wall biosynthesis
MIKISIIIPTLARTGRDDFLHSALLSIDLQHYDGPLEVIRAIDPGDDIPPVPFFMDYISYKLVAGKGSQASALNAAFAVATGEWLAVLEDDDTWVPHRLAQAIRFVGVYEFVSTTQLESEVTGTVIRVNDFPTMSGWLMTRKCWETVGPFNEDYRYHLDNEWLARLNEARLSRAHLVESTAPVAPKHCAQVRPWLWQVQKAGAELIRHTSPLPLVNRTVHDHQTMASIANNEVKAERSRQELSRLGARYGEATW